MPTIGEFPGFAPPAFAFYAELGRDGNNDRAWFDAHRATYERDVRLPMEELLARAADEFGDGKVFRPNRDVRFSHDKRPYKTHCGAIVHATHGGVRSGRYVQVDGAGMQAAAGAWELSRDQLERFREAVDDGRTGGALVRLVRAARASDLEVLGSELTRAPRGMSVDHPRIELLRHRRFYVSRRWELAGWMHTPAAYDRVAEVWRDATPVLRWLDRHVGPPREPRRPRGG